MADGSVLAPTPPQSPLGMSGQPGAPPKASPLPNMGEAASTYRKKTAEIDQRETHSLESLEAERGAREVPKYVAPKAPEMKTTSPQQAWASSAMLLAVVASAVTRTPLTTAMNAAAAALKGFHEGDMETFKTQTEQWKVATENAIELEHFQQQAYDKAMADITRREALTEKEAALDKHDAYAELLAVSAQFKDTVMADAAKSRDWATVERIKISRDKAVRDMQLQIPKVLQAADEARLARDLQNDPEYQRAQAAGDVRKMHDMGVERGIIKDANDPLKQEKTKEAIKKQWDSSVPGKAKLVADGANAEIQDLAKQGDIEKNPASQITLVDKYIYLSTSSVRPGLAQYQKLLGAASAKDIIAMKLGQVAYHPILGPQQIDNITRAAQTISDSADRQYKAFLMSDPQRAWLAKKIGVIPESYGNHPAPSDRHVQILKDKVASDPNNKAAYIKFFDEKYGEGAAEGILGGQ